MVLKLADKDEVTALIEEYKQLKSEIMNWSKIRSQFITIALTASAALFSYGFSTNNAYIFLAPLLIQIPCLFICLAERSSILTISGYIQHVIERQIPTLNWETLITEYYIKMKKNPIQKLTFGISGFVLYPILLSFLLSAIYWPWRVESNGNLEWNVREIAIFVVLLLIVLIIVVYFIREYRRESQLPEEIKKKWSSKIGEDTKVTTEEKESTN